LSNFYTHNQVNNVQFPRDCVPFSLAPTLKAQSLQRYNSSALQLLAFKRKGSRK